jgi:peptidoglycan/xylan/chitin deacetylase (PgdA/CDA1 family)
MSPLKKLYYTLSSLLPVPLLQKTAGSPALFPYNHLVSDEDVLHVKHLYPYKNIRQFKTDLDYLLQYQKPVSVADVRDAVQKNTKLPSNSFLLTFDDGFREVCDIIAPILTSKGIPAIFFVNPAFLDNRELFYRCKISLVVEQLMQHKDNAPLLTMCNEIMGISPSGDLMSITTSVKKITNLNQHLTDELAAILQISFTDYLVQKKPFLTTQQTIELSNSGFTIGAHSWDHPYYDLIADEDKLSQTARSMNFVAEQFHQPIKTFSFPHFDNNLPQSFFNHLKQQSNIDLFFGIQNQKFELHNKMLHRFNAERPDMPMSKQMKGVLLLMILRQFAGKKNVIRK